MDTPIQLLERLRADFFVHNGGLEIAAGEVSDVFAEVVARYAAPEFKVTMDGGALTTDYSGLEGLRAGWADFMEAFERIRIEPEEMWLGADGECVVEFVRLVGTPKGVAAQIESDGAAVWRTRDGKLTAVEFHLDRDAARRAGGLEPLG